ncbi:MAG: hypothetical protein P1U89_12075 [Verrucomicrobiales bacterium]|nr:hypothetical protein [Verrucomicrobiales bacterium]
MNQAIICGKSSYDANRAYNLRNAINAYYTEYRSFPLPKAIDSDVVDTATDQEIMKYLIYSLPSRPPEFSPRGISFFSDRPAKLASNGRWINGIKMISDGIPAVYDHRGNPFLIRIDTSISGSIVPPDTNKPTQETVLIWGAGRDGDYNTWENNPITW